MFENFKSDLLEILQSSKGSYEGFDNYFTSSLNKHASKKKKVLWRNEKPHEQKFEACHHEKSEGLE